MSNYFFERSENYESEIQQLLPYLQNADNPIVIFISGPTSIGKSSISIELCHLLGIRNYVCTDTLRILLSSISADSPLLQYFSHECWKYYGKFTENNLFAAFHEQSEIICDNVDLILKDALRHRKNTIIEGIHLLPSIILKRRDSFPELKILYLFMTTDFEFLKNELLPNRVVSTYRHRAYSDYDEERLARYEILQEMWKREMIEYNVSFIKNTSSPDIVMKKIFQRLLKDIEGEIICL